MPEYSLNDCPDFGVHYITVVKTFHNYCDHFYFGGASDDLMIKNFFISHRDLIELFIEYYYHEAKKLILNSRAYAYTFPDDKKECDELTNPKGFLKQEHERVTKKFILKTTSLTKRELQCIYKSALGEKAQTIATQFNVSRKTVEHHLGNARKKMDVCSTMALIRKVLGIRLDFVL